MFLGNFWKCAADEKVNRANTMRENQNKEGWAKLVSYYTNNNVINNGDISEMLKLLSCKTPTF